jgi:hypothetical protein
MSLLTIVLQYNVYELCRDPSAGEWSLIQTPADIYMVGDGARLWINNETRRIT